MLTFSFKRVGGIRFLRIGRLQFTFCVASANPAPKARKASRAQAWRAGYSQGQRNAPTVARWLPGVAMTPAKPFYHRTAIMSDGSYQDFAE